MIYNVDNGNHISADYHYQDWYIKYIWKYNIMIWKYKGQKKYINTIQWVGYKQLQHRWPYPAVILPLNGICACLLPPLHLCHHAAFLHCPTHAEAFIIKICTNNLTLVAKKARSQHFLLADNTEAISAPLPGSVITPLPPPWKLGAWLSIRQPGSSCVCCLPLWASQTRPPSPLQWIHTEPLLVTCHKPTAGFGLGSRSCQQSRVLRRSVFDLMGCR